jgi:two-component system, OmpR family, phosphate regulon response regulator PhoB
MEELQEHPGGVGNFAVLLLACPYDPAVFHPLIAQVREVLRQQVPLILGTSKRQFRMMCSVYGDAFSVVTQAPSSFEGTYRLLEAALVRREAPIPARVLEWRGYRFLLDQNQAEFAGAPIRLRPREFDLAVAFFRNVDQVLTREWLFANVWGREMENGVSFSRALDVCVSALRRKLGLRFRLQAIWGQGYRLSDLPRSLEDQCSPGFFDRANRERGNDRRDGMHESGLGLAGLAIGESG